MAREVEADQRQRQITEGTDSTLPVTKCPHVKVIFKQSGRENLLPC